MKQFDILKDSAVYCAPKSRLKLKNEYSLIMPIMIGAQKP